MAFDCSSASELSCFKSSLPVPSIGSVVSYLRSRGAAPGAPQAQELPPAVTSFDYNYGFST